MAIIAFSRLARAWRRWRRQDVAGERQHHVHEPADRQVHVAAAPPRGEPERGADEAVDGHADQAHPRLIRLP